MSSNVIIRKNGGFYYVFDDDAIIVSYLMNYKVTGGRCGFPLNSLDKVTHVLEEESINYIVRENMIDARSQNYKKNNKYNKVLDKSKQKFEINSRIASLVDTLNELPYEKASELLDKFEEHINE